MLLAGRCFAPLSKWQQKEYWLKFLIWGKNVGNKQVSFLFQSEASELNIYIKWKSMQKNLSEEQRQRDQCPAIEWVLDNQEVKSEEKILSLLPRSAKWNENAIHSFREVQVKKMAGNWDQEVKVKWKSFEIEKWNFSRIVENFLDFKN